MNKNLQEALDKDKKKVLMILISLMVVLSALSLCVSLELAIYVLAYMFLVYISFYVSKRWLTTLTFFFFNYTLCIGLGKIFQEIEHFPLNYNEWLVVLGGLTCLIIGYIIGINIPKRKKNQKYIVRIGKKISWKSLLEITYVISTLCLTLYFLKNRSILLGNVQNGRVESMQGNGLLLYVGQLHIMIVPFFYELYVKHRLKKSTFWFMCIFATIQLLLIGYRGPTVMLWITLIIIWVYEGKIRFNKALKYGILLIVLMGSYGIMRAGTSTSGFYYAIRGRLFLGMQNLIQVFRCFPDIVPFQHGSTYLINIKMLAPGPDLDFTLWLKEAMGIYFDGGGITPTIMGEFYINFGYIGMYVGMALLGIIIARVDKWLLNSEKVGFWKAFILFELASCCDGGISNVYLLPLIFIVYYIFMCIISTPPTSHELIYE